MREKSLELKIKGSVKMLIVLSGPLPIPPKSGGAVHIGDTSLSTPNGLWGNLITISVS